MSAKRIPPVIAALALALSMAAPVRAQEHRKPAFVDELKAAIAREGPAAAERRFTEIIRNNLSDYDVDPDRLLQLVQSYMQAGDQEKAMVVARLTSEYVMKATQAALPPGTIPDAPPAEEREREAKERAEAQARRQTSEEDAGRARALARLGQGREDLARFHGVYGVPPDGEGGQRTFFVSQTCEGYLLIGPLWADAGEMYMRSIGDTEFERPATQFDPTVRAHFTIGAGGKASGVTLDLEHYSDPMIRLGDLDPQWLPECRTEPT